MAGKLTRLFWAGLLTTTLLLLVACDDLDTIASVYESGDSDSTTRSAADSDMLFDTETTADAPVDSETETEETVENRFYPSPVWEGLLTYDVCGVRKIPNLIGANRDSISHIVPTKPDGFAVATFANRDDMSFSWFSSELSNAHHTQLPGCNGYEASLVALDNGSVALTCTRYENDGDPGTYETDNALIIATRPDDTGATQIIERLLPGDADWQYASGTTTLSLTSSHDGTQIVVVGEIEGDTILGQGDDSIALTAPSDRLSTYMAWFDLNGDLQSARLLDVNMMVDTIAPRPDGSYLITGYTTDVFSTRGLFVIAIDSAGELLWKNTEYLVENSSYALEHPAHMSDPYQSVPTVLEDGGFYVMGIHGGSTLLADRNGNESLLVGPEASYPAGETSLNSSFVAFYDSNGTLQWGLNDVIDDTAYALTQPHGSVMRDAQLLVAGASTGPMLPLPLNASFIQLINDAGERLGVGALPEGLTPVAAGNTGNPDVDMTIVALYEQDIHFDAEVPSPAGNVTVFPRVGDSNYIVLDLCHITQTTLPVNPVTPTHTDTDVDSDTSGVPDIVTLQAKDCSIGDGQGWPCMCQNTSSCGGGLPCIGADEHDLGICSPTASAAGTGLCDGFDPGNYGTGVVEVCGTYLSESECLCLPTGCEINSDCPDAQMCIEIGCINDFPGCYVPNEADKRKVCFPNNY